MFESSFLMAQSPADDAAAGVQEDGARQDTEEEPNAEEPERLESAVGAPGRKRGKFSLPCFPRKGDVLAGVDEDEKKGSVDDEEKPV